MEHSSITMVTLGGDQEVGKVERVLSEGLGSVARKKMKSEAVGARGPTSLRGRATCHES